MSIRFIVVCMTFTFLCLLALPVIQISAVIGQSSSNTVVAANEEQQEGQDADPFAQFYTAEDLNAIETAAGDAVQPFDDGQDDFGAYFTQQTPKAFEDPKPVYGPDLPTDL